MDNPGSEVSTVEDFPEEFLFSHISLLDLPVEIFFHICSFLDASTLVHNLGLVCKQFYEILKDDSFWKVKINRIWPNARYPLLPPDEDDELFWKLSCVTIEKQTNLWKNRDLVETFSLQNGHYGTVDAVLLINNGQTCITGGRDRLLICWSLTQPGEEPCDQLCSGLGHEGWIWNITSMDDVIYSSSWDKTIRSWDVTGNSLTPIKSHEMNVQGALLCMNSCPELHLLATGSSCRKVLIFDPRMEKSVARYSPHQAAVIQISMNSKYLVSASEDKTVSVWDVRAGAVMKTFLLAKDSFAMSMFMHNGLVYMGDSNSNIHVLEENNDFNILKSYKTEHTKGITAIHATAGSLMTASLDKTVRIWGATDPPQSIVDFECKHGDVANMHYLNEVLAASAENAIQIWRAKAVYQHQL
ncbi:F-box/WD repeat-containing protein 9-like [Fopius arisanus]|uniref:F-box/WD repeat-containing protein 9-like n=1 Tax=Fopius arisanus TaxID=64838 RepID=A0A9R1T991_9HYME|nr:PREDICTED: F-box/WD repeat-containing protein 9-like [Fopius arisanus]